MGYRSKGVAKLQRLEAILENHEIYRLAELIPHPSPQSGGRRRHYPDYMLLVYEVLVSVYGSARQVEAELSHSVVWGFMRRLVKDLFSDDDSMWLPRQPMRRHHYIYGRNRYLQDAQGLSAIASLHREVASTQAREVGLLDPHGPGSWTHPHLSRMLHADGKVVTPLFRAKPGETRTDKTTGEIKQLRCDQDGALHFEGTGEGAWGTKFVIVAARGTDARCRMILDIEWVPRPGGEASAAMDCFTRLGPHVPGAQGIIYDTALRGVHHHKLLRELGLLPVNRVAAALKGSEKPRRKDGRRVAKSVHVEDKEVFLQDGPLTTCRLYARDGEIGIGELTDRGELDFLPLVRVRTHRIKDKSGLFRWYNDYRLPESYGGGTITVRLHNNKEDAARRLNRTENVRPIPASDPDFAGLYARRNDSESINRDLDDSMWLGRAHSVGHARQHLNLIGYALVVNSLALFEHRRRRPPSLASVA
jgi:hypothetical protein